MKKTDSITEQTISLLTGLEQRFSDIEAQLDGYIAPVRKSALKRFPVLFLLLTSFGLVITYQGFELLIVKYTNWADQPVLVIVVGVLILAFTGTLYKKLS